MVAGEDSLHGRSQPLTKPRPGPSGSTRSARTHVGNTRAGRTHRHLGHAQSVDTPRCTNTRGVGNRMVELFQVLDAGAHSQRGWGRSLGRETEAGRGGGRRDPPHVAGEDRKTHGGPAGPAAAHGHTEPSASSHPGAPHSPKRPGSCRPRADAGAGRARGRGGGSSSSSKSGSGGPIPAAGWRSVHGRAGARTDRDLARRRQLLLRRSQRSCGGVGRASAPDSAAGPTPAAGPAHDHALCQPRSGTPTSRGIGRR